MDESRRSFFKAISAVGFSLSQAGVWLPPSKIAAGGVVEVKQPVSVENSDLYIHFELRRVASITRVLSGSFLVDSNYSWWGVPDGAIVYGNPPRKLLRGFHFAADTTKI